MSITLATGTTVSIASAYGTAKTFSSITNATEAVASFTTDPSLAAGDYIEVTSGWGDLDGRVVRIKAVSGTGPFLVTFEGINTSDTSLYPAGSGAGSVREITTWQQITQIKSASPTGGEPKQVDVSALSDRMDVVYQDGFTAASIVLDVYDDPSLAWYSIVESATENATNAAILLSFPNGSKTVGNASWGMSPVQNFTRGEAVTIKIGVSYIKRPKKYPT